MTTKQHLTHLESTGLIRLAQTHPEIEYLFRHALVQEAAYRSLLRADRKHLHLMVGETIERLYPDRLDELASVLGYHLARAGEMKKAIGYLLTAGERAQGLYANRETIEYFRQALTLLQDIPPNEAKSEWRHKMAAQIYEGLGDVLELIGQHDEARGAYQDALSHVSKDNLIWQARLHRKTGQIWQIQRQFEVAMQVYKQAEITLGQEPLETKAEWWQEWVQIQLDWMDVYYWQAQPQQMAKLVEKVRPAVEKYGAPAQRVSFFISLGMTNFRRDRYLMSDETMVFVQAIQTATSELDNLKEKTYAQFMIGFSYLWRGDFDQAAKYLESSLAGAERTGDVMLQSRCLTYLTILSRQHGQIEETRHYISRTLAVATTGQMLEYIATAKANLAWITWSEGDWAETMTNGRNALELWAEAQYPFRWTALWPLIGAALAQGQIGGAIEYAPALLDPIQQRLPNTLAEKVEEAIQEWEGDQPEICRTLLQQAIELAQRFNYL